jgi:hypothetical protein
MNSVLRSPVTAAAGKRWMSASAKVWIDKETRVICQGFTGKQVRFDFDFDKRAAVF